MLSPGACSSGQRSRMSAPNVVRWVSGHVSENDLLWTDDEGDAGKEENLWMQSAWAVAS
jgi:hypothetical protein